MKVKQIKSFLSVVIVCGSLSLFGDYNKYGGSGNLDDPSFWEKETLDTTQTFALFYGCPNISLLDNFTIKDFQLSTFFNGNMSFPGKTLTVNNAFRVIENADATFLGGTIKANEFWVYFSNGNIVNQPDKWTPVRFVVDGEDARVEALAALSGGPQEGDWAGIGASIVISNGTWCGGAWLGDQMPSQSNNVVLVTGANSRWEVPEGKDMFIGSGSDSNLFYVANGATLTYASDIKLSEDRGWKNGGGDRNALVVDGANLVGNTGKIIYVGYRGSSNVLAVVGGSQVKFVGRVDVGEFPNKAHGVNSDGNRFVIGGEKTVVDMRDEIRAGYDGSDRNEILVTDGAQLFLTNNMNCIISLGCYGLASDNGLRITSGAIVKAHAIYMGSGDGRGIKNWMELENGRCLVTCKTPDSDSTPPLAVRNDPDAQLVIKGTNSFLDVAYSAFNAHLRFEVSEAGLSEDKCTEAVFHAKYMADMPSDVTVDVAEDCPVGKWLLMEIDECNTAKGVSIAEVLKRITLTGAGTDRARLLVEGNGIYLKMPKRGTFLIVM